MVKKNQILDVYIEDVLFPNKAVAHVEDKKVIIKDGLKGQKVQIRISKKKGKKIEGKILEVLEKAPNEKTPDCEHFGRCGGCTYQNLPYEEQLKMKADQVQKILRDGNIDGFDFEGIVESPDNSEYRNKMEFTFGDEIKDGPLCLGMHKKGQFYSIVNVDGCKIVDEDFSTILTAVREYFIEREVPFYHKMRHEGVLRHMVVRKSKANGGILINLVTSTQMELNMEEFKNMLLSLELKGRIDGILHTLNDGLADAVKSDETRLIHGMDYIVENLLGLDFKISPFSFFQTNSLGAEKLYSLVREYAGDTKDKVVFDLFSGTGTIGQIMAPMADEVYGIELIEEAVEAANENVMINGLENCKFVAGDVFVKVDELKQDNIKPDIIVLDPPRSGVQPKALDKIIKFGAKKIVYVSCKASSLVDNLNQLKEAGYKVKRVKCVDMFPHTPHVETCVELER